MSCRLASGCLHGLGLLLLLLISVAGCSAPEEEVDPQAVLDLAADRLREATHVHLDVAGDELPADFPVLLSATGDAATPDTFVGDFRLRTGTIVTQFDILSVGGEFFVRLPFASEMTAADPSELGFRDPALLLDPDTGILSLFEVATEVAYEGAERDDGEILRSVSAQIPATAVKDLFFVAEDAGEFSALLQVAEGSNEVRRVQITGGFYDPTVPTEYSVRLTDYDVPFDVPALPGG